MTDLSWLEDYGQDNYQGFKMDILEMDEAYLTVNIPDPSYTFRIYRKHVDCINCPFVKLEDLQTDDSILVNSLRLILKKVPNFIYRITDQNPERLLSSDGYICEFGDNFGEFGIYQINVNKSGCDFSTVKNAVSISFPVLTVFLIYLALISTLVGGIFLWNKKVNNKEKKKTNGDKETKKERKRIVSLDTFRGISITIMIFVNYGAGGYAILEHANWNGLHLADLVFPWFLWIMGACVPISLFSNFKKQISNKNIVINVLKRSIKLFCLGIFLGSGSNLECMRIMAVLQRFGICYFITTVICLFLMKRDLTISQHNIGKFCTDVLVLAKGWALVFFVFLIHCLIIFLVAEDGCPQGYLGPGGLHNNGETFNCTGGASGYIDRVILGKHMYQYPTSKEVYLGTQAFDPEGLLGCLTSIVHVFFGIQAGVILLTYQKHGDRLIRWFGWSVLTGILGGALCGFSKEDGLIPVNKNLWSISFVLVTSSFAFLLLSICYILVDLKQWWSGKPFLFAGMNAILLYAGHDLSYGHLPMRWTVHCGKDHSTHFIALFENLWGTGFWLLVSYYWYKIEYFYTI